MIKILKGTKYSTETARLVGSWDNGDMEGTSTYIAEDLYQTRNLKYFVHGTGGSESTYAVHHGYSTSGSEQIRELTSSEARQWAEDKLTTEEYEKEFGELDDAASDERRPLLLKLQASTFELLRKQKTDTGMSYLDLVEQAIIELYKV